MLSLSFFDSNGSTSTESVDFAETIHKQKIKYQKMTKYQIFPFFSETVMKW